eukprot:gene20946-biopygen19153
MLRSPRLGDREVLSNASPHTSRTLVRGVCGECAGSGCAGSVRQVPAPFTAPPSVQDSLSCMNEQTPPAAESTPGGEDGPPL